MRASPPSSLKHTAMKKKIASIYKSTNKPEWTCLNFEAYRNEANELVFPEPKWLETSVVEALSIEVGDVVA